MLTAFQEWLSKAAKAQVGTCAVNAMTSASSAGHSATMRRAPASLGSLVSGLLQRSMVFAVPSVALPHQVSHHSHSWAVCSARSSAGQMKRVKDVVTMQSARMEVGVRSNTGVLVQRNKLYPVAPFVICIFHKKN